MVKASDYFQVFYEEIEKYTSNINILKSGVSEEVIVSFEKSNHIKLPYYYREWLKRNNGGELFATPAGTVLGEILGSKEIESGVPYLEYNFRKDKRWPQMPDSLFVIADTCEGDAIGFDMDETDEYDGRVVLWSHETGDIEEEWGTLQEWLEDIMEEGKDFVKYDGSGYEW